ncbi:MAG TPA: hypothetical protein VF097_11705 [Actinomycetota bacterium]
MTRTTTLALALALGLVSAACGSEGDEGPQAGPSPSPGGGELVAQVASYDLATGTASRFIVGLLTQDNRFVSGGEATFRFSFIGGGQPEPGPEVTAEFLAIPGEDPEHEEAHAGPPAEGRGVYAAREVTFDRAGIWQVEVTADVDGEPLSGTAAFQVAGEHAYPVVGDRAPRTDNLTLDDIGEAPPGAIDSRAEGGEEVPDPELHDSTIAEAIRRGRPVVAVFATPVYCVSQFCGPITDMIAELESEYRDRAEFVHVEVWRDFQNNVVNRAAADWILRNDNIFEPWVFFVDAEGVIRGRWDNVATREEVEAFLRDLPPMG